MTPAEHAKAAAIEDAAIKYGEACMANAEIASAASHEWCVRAKDAVNAAILAGVGAAPECNHESDGTVFSSDPPQYKCKLCGAFFRPKAQAAPEGWQLVPVEPTSNQMNAAVGPFIQWQVNLKNTGGPVQSLGAAIYRAMVAAAPKP